MGAAAAAKAGRTRAEACRFPRTRRDYKQRFSGIRRAGHLCTEAALLEREIGSPALWPLAITPAEFPFLPPRASCLAARRLRLPGGLLSCRRRHKAVGTCPSC